MSRVGVGGIYISVVPREGGWIAPTCRASAIGGLGVLSKEIICYSLAILAVTAALVPKSKQEVAAEREVSSWCLNTRIPNWNSMSIFEPPTIQN